MIVKFPYKLQLNNPGMLIIYVIIYVIYFYYKFVPLMFIFNMFIGSTVEYQVDVDGRF